MNAKALILMVGALVLGSTANAADDIDFSMELLSPQASVMDVGLADALPMLAYLQPMGDFVSASGRMFHRAWYDNHGAYRQSFVTTAVVRVPSKLPGFETHEGAVNADVRVQFSRNGVEFAECLLAAQPPETSRSAVYFTVDMIAHEDEVRPNKGICDINLQEEGLQVGIPVMHHKDRLTAVVVGQPFLEIEFLDGYCY